MSAIAKAHVAQMTHPKVKGSRLALFDKIAELIPEGGTMTAPISDDDLAASIGYRAVTVRRARPFLVRTRLIRVVGGQGKLASYELCALVGVEPVLPLIGRARPPVLKPTPLLDQVDHDDAIRADAIDQNDRGWRRYFDHFDRSWRRVVAYFDHFDRGWRTYFDHFDHFRANNIDHFDRSSLPLEVPIPLDVGATTKKQDPERTYEKVEVARAREPADDVESFLTWWASSFPTYNSGAVTSVDRTRDGPLVRKLLDHFAPRGLLREMAIVLWTTTTDGVRDSNRWWIAEVCTDRGLFALRHKANYLAREVSRRAQEAAAADDVWVQVLAEIEKRVNRNDFYTWWKDTMLAADHGTGIEVGVLNPLAADWIPKHYSAVVRAAVDQVRPGTEVVFVVYTAQQQECSR